MTRQLTRLSAAAFVLGISLAGPQALAGADTSEDGTATGPANATSAAADGQAQAATTRERRAQRAAGAERGAALRTAARSTPPAAAAVAESASETGSVRSAATAHRAAQRATPGNSDNTLAPSRTRQKPAAEAVVATPAIGDGVDPSSTDSVAPVEVSSPQIAPDFAAEVPTAAETAPAAQIATAGIAAAAATADSVTDLLSGALAPIQAFIEGAFLLVRRTLFNEAPTVAPVQLTGQVAGPITGTIGAVDPEGDEITYSLTAAPVFGTVTLASDGTYTYTPGDGFAGTDTFTVAAADSGLHINLVNPFRAAYTLGNAVVTQGLTGPRIQFEFTYIGGATLWSQEARAALESSATILGSYFVVSSPVTVTYAVTGEISPLSGTLASASSDIISSRSGFFNTVVQEKIISGVDANGAAADGEITWNFGSPWALGASVDNGQYDFQSVAIHELLHTFGFLSNVSEPGTNNGTGWTAFDGFLVTADGTGVFGDGYTWNSTYDTNLTGGNDGLYFGGPAAVAAYGGPVPLFTPSPWQGGSAVSHLDDMSFYGRNEQLMNAQVSRGEGIRTLSAVETAILADLGYTMVPAPGASVVLLVGVFFLRRRRER